MSLIDRRLISSHRNAMRMKLKFIRYLPTKIPFVCDQARDSGVKDSSEIKLMEQREYAGKSAIY